MHFECLTSDACECKPPDEPKVPKSLKQRHTTALVNADPLERLERWFGIVYENTQLDITFPRDRLPALAGVARHMQPFRGGKYLGGLWEDDLPVALCWYAIQSCQYPDSRLPAPSWSWASVYGTIMYESLRYFNLEVHAKYISGTSSLTGTDPYGEIASGTITIEGYVFSGELHASKSDWGFISYGIYSSRLELYVKTFVERKA